VARRRLTGQGTKGWDLALLLILLASFLATPIVAGLDGRFHWAPPPLWPLFSLLLLGYLGSGWAQAVNRHFEPSVQFSRIPTTVWSQPALMPMSAIPATSPASFSPSAVHFALGSLWAPLPAMLVVIMLAIRTDLEDATLQRELPGYAVHKWIPGNW
jgi:hypothetical protein